MIKGVKVYLAAIEKDDLPQLMRWRNNENFRKYFREFREINSLMQNIWFENKVMNDPNTIMFSIRRVEDNELLGCCGLCYLNWINRSADLSLYIGYDELYIDNLGYAEESSRLLFDYAFNQLGIHKIWTEIYEFDVKKKELYDFLGFKTDGILRDNYYYSGRWWNSLILSLLSKEYKN